MRKKEKEMRIPIGKDEKLIFDTKDGGLTMTVELGGEKVEITKAELRGLLFLFADKESDFDDLITVEKMELKPIVRKLKIKTNKDMKEGEVLECLYEYLVPSEYHKRLIETQPERYRDPVALYNEVKDTVPKIQI